MDTVSSENIMDIDSAFSRAVESYIASRREKVPAFVKRHLSILGAARLNRKAFGADFIRTPVNVFWTVPYLMMLLIARILKMLGLDRVHRLFGRVPVGLETAVHKEVKWLIYTELLEVPYDQGKRSAEKDALLEELIRQPEITSFLSSRLPDFGKDFRVRRGLEQNLLEYSKNRTAAAGIAGNMISLASGLAAFHAITPGAVTAGGILAAAIAHNTAVSNFVLGESLGRIYYGLLPATPSAGLTVAVTAGIVAALSILTSFSGIVADPLQAKLGIHQKRLNKLLDCLEEELKGLSEAKLNIRDLYLVRVFDLVDVLKAAGNMLI